jgi:hypothetical protein
MWDEAVPPPDTRRTDAERKWLQEDGLD